MLRSQSVAAIVAACGVATCASAQVFEDFEHGNEALWALAGTTVDNMDLTAGAAYAGSFGAQFDNQVNPSFRTRFDLPTGPGNKYVAKVRSRNGLGGRIYFGVGASAGGAWSAVFAPNTNQIILQNNSAWGFVTSATASFVAAVNTWYTLELDWRADNTMVVNIYDEPMSMLLASTPSVATTAAAGGVALRGFSLNAASFNDIDNLGFSGPPLPTGACCLPNGNCQSSVTSGTCTAQGGAYQGDGSVCNMPNTCPQPPSGSCCLPDGTCVAANSFDCTANNGIWGGAGSGCGTANCAKGFVYVGAAIPIPDGVGSTQCGTPALASVTVAQSFPITDIEAAYYITHTFQGDLRISLEKVSGPSVAMVDRPGVTTPGTFGFGTDNYGASNSNAGYFISNDSAALTYETPNTAGVNNPVGRWKAENPMAAFVGQDSAGTWNLKVEDCAGADTGSIVGFVLLLNMAPMGGGCYANCDASTVVPFLNVNDFVCFNNAFAAGDTYANCDQSTAPPILNVNDFICFNNAFAAGCSAP